MKILIVLFTHNKYFYCLPEVWKRINELYLPKDSQIDRLIFTEDTEDEIIKYAKENDLPIEYSKTDKKINSQEKVLVACWTVKQLSEVVQLRNAYLEIAKRGNYDWLLQVDGDVLPPKNGLTKLLAEDKKYIGAAIKSKKKNLYYVHPDRVKMNEIYECSILGNCFHLEHKDIFNFSYYADKDQRGDMMRRNFLVRKSGIKIYCDPTIKCDHL